MKNEKLTRKQYVEKKKQQLDAWNEEIDILESNALKSQKEAKALYAQKILEARAKYQEGTKSLQAMKECENNSWCKIKGRTDNVINAFRASVDEFRAHF